MDSRERSRVVLVTGASHGIGWELARCFAGDGNDVVLVARNQHELEARAAELRAAFGVTALAVVQDLSLPEGPARLFAAIEERGLQVEVLVNNAGFGIYGPFAECDAHEGVGLMRLNIVSLVVLTRLCLPGMMERSSGGILNVGSMAGFQPGPLMALYYASKAFVLSFSEALANELKGTGVQVGVLCPGPTRTGFQSRAGINGALFRRGVMSAQEVASIGYREFRRGRITVIPGLKNRLLAFAVRFAPRRLVPEVVRRLQEKRLSPLPAAK